MDNSGILWETQKYVVLHSTFIESKGVLRVKLTVTVFDAVNRISKVFQERTILYCKDYLFIPW